MTDENETLENPESASAFTVAAGSKFDELRQTNAIVHQTLGAGGSAEDCCVNLANHNDALIKRVMQSEAIAPRKITLDDGRTLIYRAPDNLVPSI